MKSSISIAKLLPVILLVLLGNSCKEPTRLDKQYVTLIWGFWELSELVVNQQKVQASTLGHQQYFETNYYSELSTYSPNGNTPVDSVIIYRNRQPILRDRFIYITNDPINRRYVAQLTTSRQYYSVELTGLNDRNELTTSPQLIVSELVDKIEDLEKSSKYVYIRTSTGKRPW